MTIYDFVTTITDKRLPVFNGAGVRREGAQTHFGKGRGRFFLCQTLTLHKRNDQWAITNTPYEGGE
jgi:hypothetical protein